MRYENLNGEFKVRAIAGTRTVLIALDCPENLRHGLMGFGFWRETVGAADPDPKWLRSLKVFRSVIPDPPNAKDPRDPTKARRFDTEEFPIQSFLWSDYTADPGTRYRFRVVPMYGAPGNLEKREGLSFEITTEQEYGQGIGVWFNRGVIASQAFAREFGNCAPPEPENPAHKVTAWLSRGLLEACLQFINTTKPGEGLRVAAYEFTYQPVLKALKSALERGVDLLVVYGYEEPTAKGKICANDTAIDKAGLPREYGGKRVLFHRTKATIPHNKFIVRLNNNGGPVSVWTGSTNFTESGFLGQSNVGTIIDDPAIAAVYLAYWKAVREDPVRDDLRPAVMALTPQPPAVVPEDSITPLFSPRPTSEMLKWFGERIRDAAGAVMITTPFGVSEALIEPLAEDRDFLRYVLMEKPPTDKVRARLTRDKDLQYAYGAVLGEIYTFRNGEPTARKPIREFELDKWLLKEDHYRHGGGFVFFVHTKFLIIDALSDDPLLCSGSANFSPNSILLNDENVLLFRGNQRVTDIFLTEFDRIFRHFYIRKTINENAGELDLENKVAFLDETSAWTDKHFLPGSFSSRRREMFFADPAKTWVTQAMEHR